MNKYKLIIFLFLVFFQSCEKRIKKVTDVNNNFSNSIVEEFFNKDDINYLLENEIDSILENKQKFRTNKKYRNKFKRKLRRRQSGIRDLSYIPYKGKKIPYLFSEFLLPEELEEFNKDSIKDFVILFELFQKRREIITNSTKKIYQLNHEEIQKFIKGDFKDSLYYKELAITRYEKVVNSNNRYKDSLQSIIHPITHTLPFGPESLGKMIAKNQKRLGFYVKQGDNLAVEKRPIRKDFFDIWSYFFGFHSHVDEDYEEVLLPPVKTYDFIDINTFKYAKKPFDLDPKSTSFTCRLSDIKGYEVYYITTGEGGYGDCDQQTIREEYCCFDKGIGYSCESIGYLVFYDRKTQHSKVIPSFILDDSGIYQVQFFYLENSTIHIYCGYSEYDYLIDENRELKKAKGYKSVAIFKTLEVNILDDKNFEIKKLN